MRSVPIWIAPGQRRRNVAGSLCATEIVVASPTIGGRWVSGAGMPERRAERIVGRSPRLEGICLGILQLTVFECPSPLYDLLCRLYIQVRAIRNGAGLVACDPKATLGECRFSLRQITRSHHSGSPALRSPSRKRSVCFRRSNGKARRNNPILKSGRWRNNSFFARASTSVRSARAAIAAFAAKIKK